MQKRSLRDQRGVALPVILIILVVMLISSIYLLRSTNSTTLTASNLAYDVAQARAADYGLHQAFVWLSTTARTNRPQLNTASSANGYKAMMPAGETHRSSTFWANAKSVTAGTTSVQYVIHRLCTLEGAYDAPTNRCTRTADNPLTLGSTIKAGDSLSMGSQIYTSVPMVHYLVTARVNGTRGGNVVTQMVVQVGA